jgi:hypothetical protein
MVWTGETGDPATAERLIVWSGYGYYGLVDTGGVYDPATDSWTTTSVVGTPGSRMDMCAGFADGKMWVYGGDYTGVVGAYGVTTNTWSTYAAGGRPTKDACTVWTGTGFCTWGGNLLPTDERSVAVFDTTLGTWSESSIDEDISPMPTGYACGVWTGTEFFLWGGYRYSAPEGYAKTRRGARYNPATDTWTAVPAGAGSPDGIYLPAVFRYSAGRVITWGGYSLNRDDDYDLTRGSVLLLTPAPIV